MKTKFITLIALLFIMPYIAMAQKPIRMADQEVVPSINAFNCMNFNYSQNSFINQYPEVFNDYSIVDSETIGDFDIVINKDCPMTQEIFYQYQVGTDCAALWGNRPSMLQFFINDILIDEDGIDDYGLHTGSFQLTEEVLASLGSLSVYEIKTKLCIWEPTWLGGPLVPNCTELAVFNPKVLVVQHADLVTTKTTVSVNHLFGCQEMPPLLNYQTCYQEADSEPIEKSLNISFTNVRTVSEKIQFKASVGASGEASVSTDWMDLFELSLGLDASVEANYTHNFSDITNQVINNSETITLDPELGECEWLGLEFDIYVLKLNTFAIGCTGADVMGEQSLEYYLTAFDFRKCSGPVLPIENCIETLFPNIDISPTQGGGNRNMLEEVCTYDIIASQAESADFQEYYQWILPDGSIIDGPFLHNVPMGVYQLEVLNQCGDSYIMDVAVCPDLETGEWIYDEETNQICATSICMDDCESENIETTLCVNASSTPWYYNESTGLLCHEIICPEGEACSDFSPVLECVPPAYTSWVYNEEDNLLCRQVICPEGEVCEDFEGVEQCITPSFGEWDYSEVLEQCRREIYANGEPTGLIDESSLIIEYTYDDFFNQCIKTSICGESEVVETYEENPTYANWNVEEDVISGFVCNREVICFGDSGNNQGWDDQINDDPEIEWEYDDFNEDCTGYVFCDGFGDWNAEEELYAEAIYSNWNINISNTECSASISCEYNLFNTFPVNETFTTGTTASYEVEGDSWSYYCLVEVECDEGNYSEMSQVGAVISSPLGNGNCLVQCSDSYSVELPCSNIAPFINTTGEIEINNPTEAKAYNEMIISYVKQEPLVSPNPSAGLITIEYLPENYEQGRLDIIASSGRVLKTIVIEDARNDINVDLTNYQDGMYLIRFLDADNQLVYQKRVVKVE